MSQPGLQVNGDALDGYARRVPELSGRVGDIATGQLEAAGSVGAGTFGRVGHEIGLPETFRSAVQRTSRTLTGIRQQLDLAGTNIHTARANYDQAEHEHATALAQLWHVEGDS